jgi:hypothetical protein
LTVVRSLEEGNLDRAALEQILPRLYGFVRERRIAMCGMGPHHTGGGPFKVAQAIQNRDSRVKSADAAILAAALTCPECDVFYTNDGTLLTSKAVRDLAEDQNVTMTEAPS